MESSTLCRMARREVRYVSRPESAVGDGSDGGGLAAAMARARCRVREPWPVPASRISRGGSSADVRLEGLGGSTWMSRRDTMREA